MDENNERQKEATLWEQCINEIKFMIEMEIIQNDDHLDLPKLSKKYGEMQQKLGLEIRGAQIRHVKPRLINAFGNRNHLFKILRDCQKKITKQRKLIE